MTRLQILSWRDTRDTRQQRHQQVRGYTPVRRWCLEGSRTAVLKGADGYVGYVDSCKWVLWYFRYCTAGCRDRFGNNQEVSESREGEGSSRQMRMAIEGFFSIQKSTGDRKTME